ncbi:MAG: LCP family protein [Bacilli bacterium]|nr:LCP family protein [Bacilli bacterium]
MKKISIFLILVTSLVVGLFTFNGFRKVDAKLESINFLVVGLDKDYNVSRSDVIILANLNNKDNKINLVSIPRDSLVSIPCGAKGTINDKINHSYVYGESNWGKNKGIDCLVQTVTRLFEIPMIPYVIFDFEAVKKSIDVIGGVTLTPKMSFKVKDGLGRILEFKKGRQINLDGEGALAFIRHRASLPNQDLDRCNNQKDLLIAVINKFNGFTRLEKIKYGIKLYSLINTNIKYDEIFELIKIDFDKYQTQTYTLKGKSIYDQGYYYILDKEYLKKIKYLIS